MLLKFSPIAVITEYCTGKSKQIPLCFRFSLYSLCLLNEQLTLLNFVS